MGMAVQLGCEPHLRAFLRGFERVFHRPDNREASEAYLLGLLSDLRRKNRDRIAEKVQGVSSPALRRFISDIPWYPQAFGRLRLERMREEARNADGLIVAERGPPPWTSLREPAVAPVGWARPTLSGLHSVVVPLVRPAAERNGHRSHHSLFPPRVSLGWLHRLIGVSWS